jgi:hypothetical protein
MKLEFLALTKHRPSAFRPLIPLVDACLQGGDRAALVQANPGGALAGGSGTWAQAPFAVAQAVGRVQAIIASALCVHREHSPHHADP